MLRGLFSSTSSLNQHILDNRACINYSEFTLQELPCMRATGSSVHNTVIAVLQVAMFRLFCFQILLTSFLFSPLIQYLCFVMLFMILNNCTMYPMALYLLFVKAKRLYAFVHGHLKFAFIVTQILLLFLGCFPDHMIGHHVIADYLLYTLNKLNQFR